MSEHPNTTAPRHPVGVFLGIDSARLAAGEPDYVVQLAGWYGDGAPDPLVVDSALELVFTDLRRRGLLRGEEPEPGEDGGEAP